MIAGASTRASPVLPMAFIPPLAFARGMPGCILPADPACPALTEPIAEPGTGFAATPPVFPGIVRTIACAPGRGAELLRAAAPIVPGFSRWLANPDCGIFVRPKILLPIALDGTLGVGEIVWLRTTGGARGAIGGMVPETKAGGGLATTGIVDGATGRSLTNARRGTTVTAW